MRIQLAILGLATAAVLVASPAQAQGSHARLLYQAPIRETGHVAIDLSGHHNTGTLKGGTSRKHGHYKFHPLSRGNHHFDRIVAPDRPSLSPGTQPFSYSVRLKVSPHAQWENSEMAVLRHGDEDHGYGGNYKLELRKTSTGVVAVCVLHSRVKGRAYIRGRGSLATIADGHFHTVTCARTATGEISLTVGGLTKTRPAKVPLTDITGQAKLMIGCQKQNGHKREQFVGKMDNITIRVG
jgi:hypothetical protein